MLFRLKLKRYNSFQDLYRSYYPIKRQKNSHPIGWLLCLCRHRPIFPSGFPLSIFGAVELNYRVRDGNGWTLNAINTDCEELFVLRRTLIIITEKIIKSTLFFNYFYYFFNFQEVQYIVLIFVQLYKK